MTSHIPTRANGDFVTSLHATFGLVPKSPIRHFQTISLFKGTDKFGLATILVRERALVKI